jgi:peptide/nickel transport system substrate-binding protein
MPHINIRYTSGNIIRQIVSDLIRVQLQKIGIMVDVVPTDSLGKTLSHASTQYDFDMVIYGLTYSPAAVNGFAQVYSSTSEGNVTYYSNKEVDGLIDSAESQTNEKEAAPYIHHAEDIIMNDAFVLPLYVRSEMMAYKDRFANIRYNIPFTYNIQEWGVKK